MLGAMLLPQSYWYPNLSEGADRVGGQLRGDKEGPFSGVTKSGRVWRKMPESDARSVGSGLCLRTGRNESVSCPLSLARAHPSFLAPSSKLCQI